jgi:SAM-dependent methyltransferase
VKILDIGSSAHHYAKQIIQAPDDAEVTTLDVDAAANADVLHDITRPMPEELHEGFDVVLASHVLEHIDRDYVKGVVVELAKAVKPGGELWIIVPSMEWAAGEIRKGRDTMAVQLAVFGGQRSTYDYHRSGFTLPTLRVLLSGAGLIVREAYQSPFVILLGEEQVPAVQDVVIGLKLPKEL